MLTVTREAFDNLNRQLSAAAASTANAITKAFETFKGELEIAHEEEASKKAREHKITSHLASSQQSRAGGKMRKNR